MITLYSTGCPNCLFLTAKLDQKGIKYEVNDSIEEMDSLGFSMAPMLKVDDKIYNFSEAVKYVNGLIVKEN